MRICSLRGGEEDEGMGRVSPAVFLRDKEVGSCSSGIVVMPAGSWPPGWGI